MEGGCERVIEPKQQVESFDGREMERWSRCRVTRRCCLSHQKQRQQRLGSELGSLKKARKVVVMIGGGG